MKQTRNLAILFVLLFFVHTTFAQDATQEATVEAAPISVVGEGTTINVNAPSTPAAPVDNSPLGLLLVVGSGFVGIIVALSLGLQAIGNRAQSAHNNPLEVAVLEKAYESIPSAFVTTIIEPFKAALERSDKSLQQALLLLNELSDKTPKSSKLAPYPPVVGTSLSADYTVTPTQTTPLPKTGPLNAEITNLHDLGGGASSGGGEEFRPG